MNDIILIVFFSIISIKLGDSILSKSWDKRNFVLFGLFAYHLVFSFCFYYYYNGVSDSNIYHAQSLNISSIFTHDFTITGIHFVSGITYVLTKSIFPVGLLASNIIFGLLGFLGFIFLIEACIEQGIKVKSSWKHHLIWFLPSLHFWTSMVGKDCLVFFGLSVIIFCIGKLKKRWFWAILAVFFLYQIRPYLPLFILPAFLVSILFMDYKKGFKLLGVVVSALITCGLFQIYFMYHSNVLDFKNIMDLFNSDSGFNQLRSYPYATTFIDIKEYSPGRKMINFLFGPFGFPIVDVKYILMKIENLLLIGIAIFSFRKRTIYFVKNASWQVVFCLTLFFFSLLVYSNISYSVGAISRYKMFCLVPLLYVIHAYNIFEYKDSQNV